MSNGYPATYHAAESDDGVRRPQVFDPSMIHFGRAFRLGDPEFDRPEDAARWREARRRATDHVLRVVAGSAWGDQLVLRGSRLLKALLGDSAREPGDLDYVVLPSSVKPTDPSAVALLGVLASSVISTPGPSGIEFLKDKVATEDIWTYERAEGRRIVFPWRSPGLPGGTVQTDIVFGENLTDPPIQMPVLMADGDLANIWAAGHGQSLAWKILWLETDGHPQGKDLYDAVILAESVFLPRIILDRTFQEGGLAPLPSSLRLINRWQVDWENFQKECPWVEGILSDWLNRLSNALQPSFALCDQPAQSVLFRPLWKSREVIALAQGIVEDQAFGRLPILADALEEAGCEEAELLAHCRAGLPHARNCWLIDSLLRGPQPLTGH